MSLVRVESSPQERAATLLAVEREVEREIRWAFVRTIGLCFLWMAAGLSLMAWAFNTTNERYALVAFWGGILVGDVGIMATLLMAYRHAEEQGWL
jgi:hypothetical protein